MEKKLTRREEEIMRHFWERGEMFVRELRELYPEPQPHFNTLSTMVRALEAKGYLGHTAYGNSFRYYPLVTEEEFGGKTIVGAIRRIKREIEENIVLEEDADSKSEEEAPEKISVEELKELIAQIESQSTDNQ